MYYRQSSRGIPRVKSIILVLFMILSFLIIGCPFSDVFTSITDELISLIRVEISSSVGLGLVGDSIQVIEIDPQEAQVTYQWQRSVNEESGFVDIDGATSDSYELKADDVGYYVRVAVTGTGEYKGTVYSTIIEVLSEPRTINIPDITGVEVPVVGHNPVRNFYAEQYFAQVDWSPSHTPFRAGTSYAATISISPKHGYTCDGVTEDFFIVEGADSTSNDADSHIVNATFLKTGNATLVSIGDITGTLEIRKTVTAGSLSPGGATATYRWLISNELHGEYVPIDGETHANYTIKDVDVDKYLKVEATGTGSYNGTVTSAARGPIHRIPLTQLGNITGTAKVGNTLTLGTLLPTEATVDHFWLSSPSIDGVYSEIALAPDSDEFKLTVEELDLFIKGRVEGRDLFDGIKETNPVGPVVAGELEAIGDITGKRLINEQLSAGNLEPLEATASYQWQFCDTKDGTYENIPGELAQLSTYVVEDEYWEKFIRVSAIGTDGYTGTVTSAPVEITYTTGDIGPGGGYIFFNKGVSDNTVGYLNDGVWDPLDGDTASKPWRYLEAAPSGWNGGTTDPFRVWDPTEGDDCQNVPEDGHAIGMGEANTTSIINTLGAGDYAAKLCASYGGGDSDWFLPSGAELLKLAEANRTTLLEGGFTTGFYWISVDNIQDDYKMAYNNALYDLYACSNEQYLSLRAREI